AAAQRRPRHEAPRRYERVLPADARFAQRDRRGAERDLLLAPVGVGCRVREVFRLVADTPPTWLVLENVPNILTLQRGSPIRNVTEWLDEHDWNWAYRTVDSRHFGVRQRRTRFLLARLGVDR